MSRESESSQPENKSESRTTPIQRHQTHTVSLFGQIRQQLQTIANIEPGELDGSFICHVSELCNRDFGAVMRAAAGHVESEMISAPVVENGLVDSLRMALTGQCLPVNRGFVFT